MARIYQSADGQWILWDGKNKTFFNTESEAVNMASKMEFARKVQGINTTIAQLFLDTNDLDSVYFSEGFDGGGE